MGACRGQHHVTQQVPQFMFRQWKRTETRHRS